MESRTGLRCVAGKSKSRRQRAIGVGAKAFMMGKGMEIAGDIAQRVTDKLLSEMLKNRKDDIFQSLGNHSGKFFDEASKESGQQGARLQEVMNQLRQRQDSFTKEGVSLLIPFPER